jgi:hypothetical protein
MGVLVNFEDSKISCYETWELKMRMRMIILHLLVIFLEHLSESRDISMSVQTNSLKKALEDKTQIGEDMPEIVVEGYQFSKHTIQEQAKLVGGAATATFSPRGASLLLYNQQGGGFEMKKRTGKPVYLDWDYLNKVGYIHLHWVPDRTREHKVDLEALNEQELHNFHKEGKQQGRHQ